MRFNIKHHNLLDITNGLSESNQNWKPCFHVVIALKH